MRIQDLSVKWLAPFLALALLPAVADAQRADDRRDSVPSVRALGDSVAGTGSALTRTRRLVAETPHSASTSSALRRRWRAG